jgi:hypothetical protein
MATQKKSANTQLIGIILTALVVYFFMKYPPLFITGLLVILATFIFAYFKFPKFHAWVKGKFQRKGKPANGTNTASTRQNIGCVCGGDIEPIANWPKFWMCTKCKKIQQKIN